MCLAVGSSEVSSVHEGDTEKRERPAPMVTSHCLATYIFLALFFRCSPCASGIPS